ncbi:MAG: FkbM family methyltransferase [Candidatus Omnitrophica bacterium]|nr:FkbM family methyltransferase [Candidatus Omnitrophota bacterium]
MKNVLKKGMVVADVGANIGYHTLQIARSVGPEGKVYAFEPDPENYRLLVKNIRENNFKNIITVQKAVSEKTSIGRLFLCEEHRGDHRIYRPQGTRRRTIEVEMVALDDFFSNGKPVDVIKIDVQGAEHLVFSGMRNLMRRRNPPDVVTEFEPYLLDQGGTSAAELLRLIRGFGFDVFSIDGETHRFEPLEDGKLIHQYVQGIRYTSLLLKKAITEG